MKPLLVRTGKGTQEVKATFWKEHLGFNLYIHKSVNGCGYTITEESTGFSVLKSKGHAYGFGPVVGLTKAALLEAAENMLEHIKPSSFKAAVVAASNHLK